MKIKFIHGIASAEWAYKPTQVAEIEDLQALKFIASGLASRVEPEIETAIIEAPENSARRTSKKR
jgi:hypothetical protein